MRYTRGMPSASLAKTLARRLFPLYVAGFFQGFVLWYTVEKLFMRSIGFDDAGIGMMVAVYSVIMLLTETPSGILADRWSRKGMLVIASLALAISSVVGGLSHGIAVYLISACFWGIFYALYSGMYDSIVYDLLFELKGDSALFQRYYGRIKAWDSVALVSSSLLGGVIAGQFGMRAAYLWTVPLSLLSVVALLFFKEPKLHKAQAAVSIKTHVRSTFKAVMQKGQLLPVAAVSIIFTVLNAFIFEFSQLWLIALAVPLFLFGTANAALLSTTGLGGLAADYLQMHRYGVMRVTMLVMVLSSLGLVVFRSAAAIVVCQALLATGLVGLGVVFSRLLHDLLPTQVRAGASSAVNTVARVLVIPLALLFGFISREYGIYQSSWLFVAFLFLAAVFMVKIFASRTPVPAVDAENAAAAEPYEK